MNSAFCRNTLLWAAALIAVLSISPPANAEDWASEAFRPFSRYSKNLGFSAGAGFGGEVLGSNESHDLALAYWHLGWIVTDTLAEDAFYAGSLELFGEVFGGFQYDPESAYLVGLTVGPRYYFTGMQRWVPFVDAGAGVSATDIGEPDLGSTFQFNLVLGVGTFYFLREDLALSFQARGIHLSNADIQEPNDGANSLLFLIGLNWVFP